MIWFLFQTQIVSYVDSSIGCYNCIYMYIYIYKYIPEMYRKYKHKKCKSNVIYKSYYNLKNRN